MGDLTPEQLAEAILKAAGSPLRHYEKYSQERIVTAASEAMSIIRQETLRRHDALTEIAKMDGEILP